MNKPHQPAGAAPKTRLLRAGRDPQFVGGEAVNPPVVRASTVVFESIAQQRAMNALRGTQRTFTYGVRGTQTAFALEDLINELEGGHRTCLLPTGLAAVGMALLACLRPGDHVLVSDSVYEPTRRVVKTFLARYGIESSFFRPDGSDVEPKFQSNTRLVLAEVPGSLIYEMCDLRQLAALARSRGARLAVDNTWGVGTRLRPIEMGADLSIVAATKYLSGHSDVMMGSISANEATWGAIAECMGAFGMTVSPDDAYLVLRGARSMAARLQLHEAHTAQVLDWLQTRPEIQTIFSPVLPSHPGHDIWLRDCGSSNGLVSFELKTAYDQAAAERLADALQLFGIGLSWGGYESLVSIANMANARSLEDWSGRGPVVRLHVGLEDPRDLIADLERGFEALVA
jgi:cystathionine beta-lyase